MLSRKKFRGGNRGYFWSNKYRFIGIESTFGPIERYQFESCQHGYDQDTGRRAI